MEDALPDGWDDAQEEAAILSDAASGNHVAMERLMDQYKPLVRARARAYHLAGADHEDLVQEGMIGLFKAIRDYRTTTGARFAGFADLCVTRQIQSAVKAAARKKHLPLNTYLSLSAGPSEQEGDAAVSALREPEFAEPESHLILREDARQLVRTLDKDLSPLERQVVALYMAGENYQTIALRMKRTPKSIDNALQRIRRKMGAQLRTHRLHEDNRE